MKKHFSWTHTDSEGRIFYLWEDQDLRKIFLNQGFTVIGFLKSASIVNSKDTWLGYVLNKGAKKK